MVIAAAGLDGFVSALGLVGSACVGVSLIPQVVRTVRAGHADQISPLMISLMSFASFSMVVYGCYFRVAPVIIANGSVGINSLVILRYKCARAQRQVHSTAAEALDAHGAEEGREGNFESDLAAAQRWFADADRRNPIGDELGIARREDERDAAPLLKRTNSMPVVYPRPGSGKIPVEQEWTPHRAPLTEPTAHPHQF